jgi:hypothetical protein
MSYISWLLGDVWGKLELDVKHRYLWKIRRKAKLVCVFVFVCFSKRSLKQLISSNSEINPTRCNNCVYSSQWLYSTCFGWHLVGFISLLSMMHGTTNIKLLISSNRTSRNVNFVYCYIVEQGVTTFSISAVLYRTEHPVGCHLNQSCRNCVSFCQYLWRGIWTTVTSGKCAFGQSCGTCGEKYICT